FSLEPIFCWQYIITEFNRIRTVNVSSHHDLKLFKSLAQLVFSRNREKRVAKDHNQGANIPIVNKIWQYSCRERVVIVTKSPGTGGCIYSHILIGKRLIKTTKAIGQVNTAFLAHITGRKIYHLCKPIGEQALPPLIDSCCCIHSRRFSAHDICSYFFNFFSVDSSNSGNSFWGIL